jgi:hypothetical protein
MKSLLFGMLFLLGMTGIANAANVREIKPVFQGTTQTLEAQGNTLEARRIELKEVISKNIANEPRKTIIAVHELLKMGRLDDVVHLIKVINENQKSSAIKEIRDTILTYPDDKFIVASLEKAGQELDPKINIFAANMLIDKIKDMKYESPASHIIVTLIKKGVLTSQVIDIMERVKNTGQYNLNWISRELNEIAFAEAYPREVRAFSLLMVMGYFKTSSEQYNGTITGVLGNANHEYLLNAITLLEKGLAFENYPNSPWEIIKTLKKSKDTQIAKMAIDIDAQVEKKEKKEWQETILGGPKTDPNMQDNMRHDYLEKFGDTKENVLFLINILRSEQDERRRSELLEDMQYSKQDEVILPVINKMALNDKSSAVRLKAVQILIGKGFEKKAFEMFRELINQENINGENLGLGLLLSFKNKGIIAEVGDYLNEVNVNSKYRIDLQAVAAILLSKNYNKEIIKFKTLIEKVLNDKSTNSETAGALVNELADLAVTSPKQRNDAILLLEDATSSANLNVSERAKKTIRVFLRKFNWWKEYEKNKI